MNSASPGMDYTLPACHNYACLWGQEGSHVNALGENELGHGRKGEFCCLTELEANL